MERRMSLYLLGQELKTPAERLGHGLEKMEGHITFHLFENKNLDARSESKKQEIECHTTFYLHSKLPIIWVYFFVFLGDFLSANFFLGLTTSQTASGCLAATCNKTRAGPWGCRRPCSQF